MSVDLTFTGTRDGMTEAQQKTVVNLLNAVKPDVVRHGDCIGADAQFHRIIRNFFPNIRIIIHPPSSPGLRARCAFGEMMPPQPFLARNRDMVNASSIVIAAPKESQAQNGGGTWYTARYASKMWRQVCVVLPDGGCLHNDGTDACIYAEEAPPMTNLLIESHLSAMNAPTTITPALLKEWEARAKETVNGAWLGRADVLGLIYAAMFGMPGCDLEAGLERVEDETPPEVQP
jgi:hypothetical protein